METYFAPAPRTDLRKFKNQIESITHSPIIDTLLQTTSGLLIILNEDRQVVSINHSLLDTLGITDIESVIGLRLGQMLSCIHAEEAPHGCGTTPECKTCGAAIAMMSAINDNITNEQICILTKEQSSGLKDECFLVKAQPITVENHRWILFFAQDITRQQFWLNMERNFFHELSNLLTTLAGNCELLSMDYPQDKRVKRNKDTIDKLCNEVSLQMDLLYQEETAYYSKKSCTTIKRIKDELHVLINKSDFSKGIIIQETWRDEDVSLYTDSHLLLKVLWHMVINALEATVKSGKIKINEKIENKKIIFEVWNLSYIHEELHNRIFQRFFSTKSTAGRGLGTYYMKLYGEKYLKGKISFSSDKKNGTSFSFTLPC